MCDGVEMEGKVGMTRTVDAFAQGTVCLEQEHHPK